MDDETALLYDLTETASLINPSLSSPSSSSSISSSSSSTGALSSLSSLTSTSPEVLTATITMPTIFPSHSTMDALSNAIINDQTFANITLTSSPSSTSILFEDDKLSNDVPIIDFHMLKLSLLFVMFILILCGNVFVLFALSGRKLRKNRMYFFLYHLSIADLLTGFGNVLSQFAWEAHGRFYGGNALCKLVKYVQILGPYLSSYVLVMTAIDRYQAICHPLSNSGASNTGSRSRKMIGVAWTIALVSSAPQVLIFSYKLLNEKDDVYECWATFPMPWTTQLYVTWYAISIFFVPFVILTYTHVLICREIWFSCNSKRASFLVQRKSAKLSQYASETCSVPECASSSLKNTVGTCATNGHYHNIGTTASTKQLLLTGSNNNNHCHKHDGDHDNQRQSSLRKWFTAKLSKLSLSGRERSTKYSDSSSLQTTACRNESCCASIISGDSLPPTGQNGSVHLCINPLPMETTALVGGLGGGGSGCCLRNSKSDSDISDSQSKKSCSSRGGSLKSGLPSGEDGHTKVIKPSMVKKPGKPVVPTHHRTPDNIQPVAHTWVARSERSSSEGSGDPGIIQPVVPRMHRIKSGPPGIANPRVHSMHGLTRAKIKTVKVTLVVISCYVACSCPFICVQLWSVYWPGAQETKFWNGTTIAILMLLACLNSCVNPWIYLYFNPNLASSFFNRFFRSGGPTRRSNSDGQLNSAQANGPLAPNNKCITTGPAIKKTSFKPNGSSLSNERKYSPAFGPEVMPLEGVGSSVPRDRQLFRHMRNESQTIFQEPLHNRHSSQVTADKSPSVYKRQQQQKQLQKQLEANNNELGSMPIHRKVTASLTNESTSNMTASSVNGSNDDNYSAMITDDHSDSGNVGSRSRRISVQLERAWSRLVQHPV